MHQAHVGAAARAFADATAQPPVTVVQQSVYSPVTDALGTN
jgi:hypothetical protein